MSKEYKFMKIEGQYPSIRTEVRDGQRYVQLTCEGFSTAVHRHFPDAFEEWQDRAARLEMEAILAKHE